MNLVIVESPTKARTLAKYLGDEFQIEASMGHVRDLPKSRMAVDVDKNFAIDYELVADKSQVIKTLRKAAGKASQVFLAMDPDREGEAIAYHVRYVISENPKSEIRNMKSFKRVTFHEITKEAILGAMENPGELDMKLVDAQQARRVVDRLAGYSLSPVLWKKVRRGLSAGRVQSVALRLIVEREAEIGAFKPQEYWDIWVRLLGGKVKEELRVQLVEIEGKRAKKGEFLITDKIRVNQVAKALRGAKYVVKSVERKGQRRSPYPPFTTSTLQQAAANVFGWTARQTMRVAQQLYEQGKITYHRTDSVNLSKTAVSKVRELVKKDYGEQYLPESQRFYRSKAKNAQEAHEAIRPTDVGQNPNDKLQMPNKLQEKLYSLVWRRMVASQMADAIYDLLSIEVEADEKYGLKAKGSIRKFDGWRKLYDRNVDDVTLPALERGEGLNFKELKLEQKFTQPPPRFNDASLIKALEQRGIGRPSTYAPIISTIIARGYVERKERRFFSTAVGKSVIQFLKENFKKIMDYNFTAEMEEDLDRIARGEKQWVPMVKKFWGPFIKRVKDVEKNAKRVAIPVTKTGKKCPKCKQGNEVIRSGRFGKFLSCSTFPDCKYTASFVETVKGFKCEKCKQGNVVVKRTRSGRQFYGCSRYPKCDWGSWRKPRAKK